MEIIPLMPIAVIILLSSFPAPIKVAGRGGGGGFVGSGSGSIGIGSGYRGGNIGTGGSIRDGSNVGTGYRGGANPNAKPSGGGDTGASIVVIPKKPEEPAKVGPMPQVCKQEVRDCISAHIYGNAGAPKHRGPCCVKLKHSVPCVCKFLTSPDPKLSKGANDVLRGCHYRKPKCPKMPMPQVCRHEVRHCINSHIYGGAGEPQYRGACCKKFKHSKKCVCTFITSQDSILSKNANGVVRGCRFSKPNCPKI